MEENCRKCGKSISKHWDMHHDFTTMTPSEERGYGKGLKDGFEQGKVHGRQELQEDLKKLLNI
jgi:hypothetical protein